MSTATVTSSGQITIPHEIRSALGIGPGSTIQFTRVAEKTYEITVLSGSVRDLKGALSSSDRGLTLEEVEKVIADAAGGSAP